MKTQFQRIPTEWTNLVQESIKKIEENGYPKKVLPPHIIRLLIHYRPARQHLNQAFEEIIKGFEGIQEVRPEVMKWARG